MKVLHDSLLTDYSVANRCRPYRSCFSRGVFAEDVDSAETSSTAANVLRLAEEFRLVFFSVSLIPDSQSCSTRTRMPFFKVSTISGRNVDKVSINV